MEQKIKKNSNITSAKQGLSCLAIFMAMLLTACSGDSQSTAMAGSINNAPNAVSDATRSEPAELPQEQKKYAIEEMNPQIPGSVYRYSEGMGGVKYNEKYGYLGPDGNVVIDPQYGNVSPFEDGYAAVQKDDGYAMIDTTGKELFVIQTDQRVDSIEYLMMNGKFIIPIEGGYQLYDSEGKPCFPQPISANLMSRGLASDYFIWNDYTKKELFVTDDTGTLLFEPIQNFDIDLTYNHYAHRPPECIYREGVLNLTIEPGKSVALDNKGNQLFEKSFEELKPAGEGLIPFLEYGKWGYVDFSGNVVVEAQYEDAFTFSEGLAAVVVDGEMGFIDKSGTMVIQPQFSTEYNVTLLNEKCTFKNGLAAVALDKGIGALIDTTGACLIQAQGSSRFLYDPTGFVSIYYGESSKLYKVTQG